MNFSKVRRQKLLGQVEFEEHKKSLDIHEASRKELLSKPGKRPGAAQLAAWWLANGRLERLILNYTGGEPLDDIASELPSVIEAFAEHNAVEHVKPDHAAALELTQIDAYVRVIWLLSLSTLLGHRELVPVVLGWVDKDPEFNRGRDGLFEFIVEKLTGSRHEVERVLLHPDPYRSLAKATVVPPDERAAQVQAFLKDWYKGMDDCYWHGSHTDKGSASSFFGYWSFEAALVTYLWNIDDTSYRDHQFYPKDLVDYAREHFPYTGPSPQAGPARALRSEAGQPCPQAGWWFTPAQERSRARFEAGEVMPALGGDYGATIWQWDVDQDS